MDGSSVAKGCVRVPRAGRTAGGGAGTAWYKGGVELAAWLVDDLGAVRARFLNAIAAHVPEERWAERADGGGSSIAALLLHVAVHQDLAVRTALGGQAPRFAAAAAGSGWIPAPRPWPACRRRRIRR